VWHVARSDREATVFFLDFFLLSPGVGWVRPSGFARKLVKERFLLFRS
jgi:hypothetical protein